MPQPPWRFERGLESVLERWTSEGSVRSCVTDRRAFDATAASMVAIPETLDPAITRALTSRGIERLYSHQAQAFTAASAKKHVVVSTPTASGKSLCFHLPVLDALAKNPEASAIYLYPTKALSRDQEASVREIVGASGLPVGAIVFDGDTPGDARRAARQRSSIVMTNPDMLHAGILPHHASWARIFQNLAYVVVDELHTYRGVFGSHVALVLERLRRVARFHGANPRFLCATATIGNPKVHAETLIGARVSSSSDANDEVTDEVVLVGESGAPRGPRHVVVYNPPVVNAELGVRASYLKSAVRLTTDLLRARVPTIVFGQSRNSVEIMLKYLRDALAAELSPEAIMAYRGGYLPETRRKIEKGLREGEILGVIATNALELGIDVGDLDAVVCAGYPGSVAGTWQRFGRAGRRGKASAAILVGSSAALDQYVVTHTDHLLGGAVEEARIDPKNTEILIQHLKCAAFELPFTRGEAFGNLDADETIEALGFLEGHGVVHESAGRFHWSTDAYPATHVSLRSVGWDNTVIIDVGTGRTLAELDWRATPTMLHEQAIYQHDAEQFQVERLDHENHKAFVKKVEPDYFTTALSHRKVSIIERDKERGVFRGKGAFGEVSVVEKVTGFKKIKFFTHENAGYGDVRLPDIQMHTASFWWTVPSSLCLSTGLSKGAAIDGLRGILRTLELVSTVALMCDPRDIGQTLDDGALGSNGDGMVEGAPGFDPTLFLFDNVPGGIGLAARIYEEAEGLLVRARGVMERCGCDLGCPMCVGAVDAGLAVVPVTKGRKAAALELLAMLVLDG